MGSSFEIITNDYEQKQHGNEENGRNLLFEAEFKRYESRIC
jgi:hypothetical protein